MNRLTRTNQTIFGTLAAIFSLSIGCFMCGKQLISAEQGGDHYWTSACVTGDESLLIAGGDEAASVDLATGAVVKSVPMYVETVSCSQQGGIAYAASEDMVRFPEGVRGPTDDASARDLAGPGVHFTRDVDNKGQPRSDAKVDGFELEPSLFGDVGAAHAAMPSAFFTKTGGVMSDGRLVLAAGWTANRSGNSVEPAAWSVFAVNPSARTVTALISKQSCTPERDTSLLWKVAASSDAKQVAVAFRGEGTTRVATYEAGRVRTMDIAGAREPTAMEFSAKGDRLAVATLSEDGSASKLTWFDAATGKPTWTSPEAEGTIHFLHHLKDGSLVFVRSTRVVTRVAPDGTSKSPK